MATSLARKASSQPPVERGREAEQASTLIAVVRAQRPRMQESVRFFALDSSVHVCVEADSEDDARSLCREMQWEFIALRED